MSSRSGRTSRKRRRFTFRSVVGRTMVFGFALLMLVCYASMYVNPADFWPAALFTIAAFVVGVLNLVVLVLSLLGRSRVFWVPLIVLVPMFFMVDKQISFSAGKHISGDDIRMVSYNVGQFQLPQGDLDISERELRRKVLNELASLDMDIVCLQEFAVSSGDNVREIVRKYFPGYYCRYFFRGGSTGNITISRFPIVDGGVEDFENSANMALFTDLQIGGEVYRLYNCHFQSYSISTTRLVKLLNKDNDYEFAYNTGRKIVTSIRMRPEQVGEVMDNMRKSPYKSIVCGDFNDTPMSYTYSSMARGRKDTFVECGGGFAGTYSKFWPLLRIDYILVPDKFEVTGHDTPHLKFSDHYPVMTSFRINGYDE